MSCSEKKQSIAQKFISLWYKPRLSVWLFPLTPFSFMMKTIVKLRFLIYRLKITPTVRATVPVIIAGNITTGGSGKTPLVGALASHLTARGFKPGIVSRGYGATIKTFPSQVFPDSNPTIYGDEPVMLAQITQTPLVIDPDRPKGVQMLTEQLGCDVIISDDGLQHYRLARDIEIIVLDGKRGLGNHYCLPAGPLREPAERLHTADFLVSKGKTHFDFTIPCYVMKITGKTAINLNSGETLPLTTFTEQNHRVHAVAGIGNPESFFETLCQAGMHVIEHYFPDHHHYCPADLAFNDNIPVVMTEKDAVKCRKFAHENMWYFPVIGLMEDAFWKKFDSVFYSCANKYYKQR